MYVCFLNVTIVRCDVGPALIFVHIDSKINLLSALIKSFRSTADGTTIKLDAVLAKGFNPQSKQNWVSGRICRIRRSEHITPVLISLHWLHVQNVYLLQTGSYDVSIHPQHLSVLPTVVFHPPFRHDIQTTAAVFYLSLSGSSARLSLYRQEGVSGFWCHRLKRPASPRRICAVTCGFHTATRDLSVFPFLPRHYPVPRVLLLPFVTSGVWTYVVLAVMNII